MRMKERIILDLYTRGRAFKIELAAALLTFIEEIEPILTELENEGFIKVGYLDAIYLTKKGRKVAKSLLEREKANRLLKELGWD
jgi:Mn-dependent DtxR family transcriptional regulator